ncbi:MAG TPA: heterodisulfide reductase-related iron-sulfur binding cluster [Usitatibacter sp.]|jgi:Fe-S oxidoreductase|nr:heterodisulfide reductase-related iron-sulfur binding cluster [Usitatibacter sp.]
MKEGSLEAPTRHPIDWKSPEYRDEPKIVAEMERIFDICHGCRRCVSLCNAFPTLFDAVDETDTGEVAEVPKAKFWEVVEQCYLCDLCYMVKCPYVPPHPWNVDFPHLMLRAKSFEFDAGRMKHPVRDRMLSSTDRNGKLATIPVVVQFVNAATKSKPLRALGEKVAHVDRDAWLPSFAPHTFRPNAAKSRAHPVRDGERTAGKVAIFSTCYVNYNEPGIGHDLVKILDHNEIPYVLVQGEACCGMPRLEQGDLHSVEALKNRNVPLLVKLAREGYAIVTPVPSCTLMFKQELPLMFPHEEDVALVRDAMADPFEYLMARKRDGLLRTEFPRSLGKVAYHVPCHSRVQKIGLKTQEALQSVPGTEVTVIERCSGHAGTYGVKEEFHDVALKIGRPVFRQAVEAEAAYVSSDCQLAGHHIEEGIGRLEGAGPKPELRHPITLLRMAYGLPD